MERPRKKDFCTDSMVDEGFVKYDSKGHAKALWEYADTLEASHKDLLDTLELLLTDIEWQENSPTLKLVKRMIKKAKNLNN